MNLGQLYDFATGMSRREHVHSYFHQEISAEGTSVGNQGRFLARHEVYLLYLIFLIRVQSLVMMLQQHQTEIQIRPLPPELPLLLSQQTVLLLLMYHH